jgi:hypothetical protein
MVALMIGMMLMIIGLKVKQKKDINMLKFIEYHSISFPKSKIAHSLSSIKFSALIYALKTTKVKDVSRQQD